MPIEPMEMNSEAEKQGSKLLETATDEDKDQVKLQTMENQQSKLSEMAAEVDKQETKPGNLDTSEEEICFSDTSKDSQISKLVADLAKAKESLGEAIETLQSVSGQILGIENNLLKHNSEKQAKELQLPKKEILPGSQTADNLMGKVDETSSHCGLKDHLDVAQKKIETYEKISGMLLNEDTWLERDRQMKNLEAEESRLNRELQLACAKIRGRDAIISILHHVIEEWPEVNRVDMQLFLSEILQEVTRGFLFLNR